MVDVHSEEYILGQNIRKYRIQKGWSQADLSIAVDVDRADISKYAGFEYVWYPFGGNYLYWLGETYCGKAR